MDDIGRVDDVNAEVSFKNGSAFVYVYVCTYVYAYSICGCMNSNICVISMGTAFLDFLDKIAHVYINILVTILLLIEYFMFLWEFLIFPGKLTTSYIIPSACNL